MLSYLICSFQQPLDRDAINVIILKRHATFVKVFVTWKALHINELLLST